MKDKEFLSVVKSIPVYKAMFRVIRVSPWLKKFNVKKGDQFYYDEATSGFKSLDGRVSSPLFLSNFKFERYLLVDGRNPLVDVPVWAPKNGW